MLIEKNFEVLQYAVDQGTAGSIDLHFSTNGTVWNQDIEQLLGHFRRVYFDLSIDDIGTRCGYIRYPSDWDQVNKNLLELQQAQLRHPQFVLCVCITVTNLNIYYLDEIYDHFSRLGLPCNFNFLHLPWHLNLKVLPTAVKQKIIHKLAGYSVPAELDGWYHDYWNSHMPAIENFMMTAEEAADQYFREFHYYTRGLDRSRDQSLEQSLPEFAALIKPWFDQFDSESSA
jgi:sulfatase maturation enzyme AslB (radical SAM superfamily)